MGRGNNSGAHIGYNLERYEDGRWKKRKRERKGEYGPTKPNNGLKNRTEISSN